MVGDTAIFSDACTPGQTLLRRTLLNHDLSCTEESDQVNIGDPISSRAVQDPLLALRFQLERRGAENAW